MWALLSLLSLRHGKSRRDLSICPVECVRRLIKLLEARENHHNIQLLYQVCAVRRCTHSRLPHVHRIASLGAAQRSAAFRLTLALCHTALHAH
jgi:hypothetical protein